MRQEIQLRPKHFRVPGEVVGGLDLSHDLGLAQYLRVEAGSDPHEVPGRLSVPQRVGRAGELAGADGAVSGNPIGERVVVPVRERAIDLGAVAGRQDGRFGEPIYVALQSRQGLRQLMPREGNAFSDVDGRRAKADAVSQ